MGKYTNINNSNFSKEKFVANVFSLISFGEKI